MIMLRGFLHTLAAYLGRHRKTLLLLAVFLLVQFTVYRLYGLPAGPAVYTALLTAALALLLGAAGWGRYRRRLNRLDVLNRQAAYGLGEFPRPADEVEHKYQQLVTALENRCRETERNAAETAARATRYYTLWSHQVKTPLAAMRLLLQEEELDRGALEQELLKTGQYVEMVLQYQRLGASTQDLLLEEHSLGDLVRQAVKRVAPLFIHKKIGLELTDSRQRVLTDEKWLVFVLEQLLTNAVKYTPAGGKVSVFLETDTPLTLVIADTGIGIRADDLPRVFEWGYTGYNGRTDQRSTGIGLCLCRQAMEMLGHSIRLTSQVGKGTRVILGLSRRRFEMD